MGKSSTFNFQKVGNTRVIPLYLKIVGIFIFFLLVSNFSSNLINLIMNRGEQVNLLKALLLKDLKELFIFAGNQFDIFNYDKNLPESVKSLKASSERNLTRPNAMAFGLKPDGSLLFFTSKTLQMDRFTDETTLSLLKEKSQKGEQEGGVEFFYQDRKFFGFYKYHSGWEAFLVRAEDEELFFAESWRIFWNVSWIIVIITIASSILGIFVLRMILSFVGRITHSLMNMQKSQELSMIDMKGAPNDDVTYLGLSFNALSNTIGNLMNIFRKFVTQDVAYRAYKEREIRLEGRKMELTILFSDIKGFTYMTETLGNDIIKLLNLHYDKAIRHIQAQDGIVGSIIGDALLAVFGSIEGSTEHKSLKSIKAAYMIHEVAARLRTEMEARKNKILDERGHLTPEEERVYKAVLLEVGVGIDGGEVFYGNIGSYVRMTNTVIGDNVNSASRLEGLTRTYKVPVIVSEFVKNEVEEQSDLYHFQPLDLVQVKGKTEGKKIFWPIEKAEMTDETKTQLEIFTLGLNLYLKGNWKESKAIFEQCQLSLAEIFKERMEGQDVPAHWNGIWTMTSK